MITKNLVTAQQRKRQGSALRRSTALAALVIASASAGGAMAQSTASQIDEIIVNGSRPQADLNGLIKAEEAAKTRSTITQEYIGRQVAGQSVLQTINLLPGVNFTNSDPYGNSGGNLRIRSFDGNRISLTLDGIPLNDTGNYAIYSNQQVDSEIIERVNVNLGTTDVDSPTASATGGTVNYVTMTPGKDLSVTLSPSIGSHDYRRIFGMVETGEWGSLGTTAFLAGSYTKYDKFKGPGTMEKKQVNARIHQPLGGEDFIAISGHFNWNRNNFYRNPTLKQWKELGDDFEYLSEYERDEPTAGEADIDPSSGGNFYGLSINPSDTGNIRAQSRFSLADNLILTVDPAFQYVLANGGGSQLFNENDPRLIGNSDAAGVDLNGDGDVLDSVRLYRPNTTNTRRFIVNSSLIWNINDQNRIRFAYTYDRGRHRQTGEAGYIEADGHPENVFAGRNGEPVHTADGDVLRTRDRKSIALLNQISAEYQLKLLDDNLRFTAGVRAPFFKRELNQYCYTIGGIASAQGSHNQNQYCTTADTLPSSVSAPVIAPYEATRKWDDILPNLGVSYRFNEVHQIYASYAEGLSAPRTDNLYGLQIANPEPETTQSVDVGYRYQSGRVIGSTALWYSKFKNRIVSSYDEALNLTIDRNVGSVDLWGVDAEVGFKAAEGLTFYLSGSYINSEVQQDLQLGPDNFAPTKGKELVETPEWQFGGRAEYAVGNFAAGVQAKYVGSRWATDINDEKAPSYTVVDLDVSYDLADLMGVKGMKLQFNVINLFDEEYLGNVSSRTRASQNPTYSVGAPRTVQATLKATF
ncbi:TonB-dependent receptor [Pedomonas mirosovicensis]|uniref:TonB-dependent receptor n=1 Tax=Pedomonas mirosovicensis TaxID=2908641 RepID=UPI0021674031|nr:TonB-dependent receptor [Pedomonas mirosovicensis]MCH8684835.1 TonB-dependent receptor [Pedomonas mirosovicensis]